jgi:hypothetical protein
MTVLAKQPEIPDIPPGTGYQTLKILLILVVTPIRVSVQPAPETVIAASPMMFVPLNSNTMPVSRSW